MYVFFTCFFEWCWVFGMNVAATWWHWCLVAGILLIDFFCLSKACEILPAGTVYAIFAGAGTVGTALMDVWFFGGTLSFAKGIFIGILIAGVIGLKVADRHHGKKKAEGVA